MRTVHGTYRAGRVDLDSAVDWPDGSRVAVVAEPCDVGLNEGDWQDSPESRAMLLERMRAFEPLEFTPEEEAEIAAARHAIGEFTIEAVRRQMEKGL